MANEIDYDDVFGQILGSVTEDDMPEVKEEKSVPELTQEDKDILKSYQDLMEKNEDKEIQFMGIARNGSLYSYQGSKKNWNMVVDIEQNQEEKGNEDMEEM